MTDSNRLSSDSFKTQSDQRGSDTGRRALDYISGFISRVGFPVAVATFLLLTLYRGQQDTNIKLDRIITQNERIIILLEVRR